MKPEQLIDLLAEVGMLKEESPGVFGWHPTMAKAERFYELITAQEREDCAKVCEAYDHADPLGVSIECAAAIRSRK